MKLLNFQRYYSFCTNSYDLVIVGGGIIGISSANEIQKTYPHLKIAVVEKESKLGAHQTSHNSGVIHSGIYYTPRSLKAQLCVQGAKLAYEYMERKNIAYKKCGKLIIATNQRELTLLENLYTRGLENNVDGLKIIDRRKIKDLEPYCEGVRAIWSPSTGITDWSVVNDHLAKDFQENGGDIYLNSHVIKFRKDTSVTHPVIIMFKTGKVLKSRIVLTCAGLQSDLMSRLTDCSQDPRIIPFRGEYLILNQNKCQMVQRNLYPVPNPNFPFLGVHFTPRLDGSVWIGPNAVLAFKREGYKWTDFELTELLDNLKYSGFQKLCKKYFKYGFNELSRSICLSRQLKELQKFIPDLSLDDIRRGPTGVRAQALDSLGNLVDDFVFDQNDRVLHCRNAPSPAATSSLAIAKVISEKLNRSYDLKNLKKNY